MATNGAAPAHELPQMLIAGHAESTKREKSLAVKNFVKFLESTNGKYPVTMEAVPTAALCGQAIWLEYAHFLVNDPCQLKADTVVEYMRKTLGVVKDAHGKAGSPHYDFFAELANKDSRDWLMGALRQVNVQKFREATAKGEAMSSQASPIYAPYRRELVKALLRKGTTESILRAAVIQCNGAASGRPGEISGLSPDVTSWDPLFTCVAVVWHQFKTHKQNYRRHGRGPRPAHLPDLRARRRPRPRLLQGANLRRGRLESPLPVPLRGERLDGRQHLAQGDGPRQQQRRVPPAPGRLARRRGRRGAARRCDQRDGARRRERGVVGARERPRFREAPDDVVLPAPVRCVDHPWRASAARLAELALRPARPQLDAQLARRALRRRLCEPGRSQRPDGQGDEPARRLHVAQAPRHWLATPVCARHSGDVDHELQAVGGRRRGAKGDGADAAGDDGAAPRDRRQ